MSVAAEIRTAPFYSGGPPRVHVWARFTVGAAGAVTLDTDFSDANIDLGDFASGEAELTYPGSPRALITARITPAALANDQVIYVTAQDSGAGTATLTVADDGSAEDPADGAVIVVEIIMEKRGR